MLTLFLQLSSGHRHLYISHFHCYAYKCGIVLYCTFSCLVCHYDTMDKLHPGHVMQLARSCFCWYQLICSLGLPARTGSKSRMLKLIVACTHTFSFPAQVSTRPATANGVQCLQFRHNLVCETANCHKATNSASIVSVFQCWSDHIHAREHFANMRLFC